MRRSKINLAMQFLWGEEWKQYPNLEKSFQNFIESRFYKIGCCVIWDRSKFFEAFRRKYPNLPDIGRKQVIFKRDGDGILYVFKKEDYKNASLKAL